MIYLGAIGMQFDDATYSQICQGICSHAICTFVAVVAGDESNQRESHKYMDLAPIGWMDGPSFSHFLLFSSLLFRAIAALPHLFSS